MNLVLLDQYVTHRSNASFSIIGSVCSYISTCVWVIRKSSHTESNPRTTGWTAISVVTKYTNSCLGTITSSTHSIKPLHITVELQRRLRANQALPRITALLSGAVISVSDQREKRVGVLVDSKESYLMTHSHAEADLGEGSFPVGW